MAALYDIQKVVVGPKYLSAYVHLSDDAPVTTDVDLHGTTLVYNLLPGIVDHVCTGDAGHTFKEAMPATETAHLLEHVAVELMAQTGLAEDIACGCTRPIPGELVSYEIRLSCPDDVLTTGALSSAAWILNWAYSGGEDPEPDIPAIVSGLQALVGAAFKMQAEEAIEEEEALMEDMGATEDDAEAAEATEGATQNSETVEVEETTEEPAQAEQLSLDTDESSEE